jgi:CHAT domain-containing protein
MLTQSFLVKYKGSYPAGVLALAFFVAGSVSVWSTRAGASAKNSSDLSPRFVADSPDTPPARALLDEGKRQLNHFKLYAALDPLEQALKLYANAGDQNGVGAACDALGDLYQREGQYSVAQNFFQRAREAFLANKDSANANLTLAKLGELYLLSGNLADARAALSVFEGRRSGATNADAQQRNGPAGFSSFLASFDALACSNRAVTDRFDPPFMGHGPIGPNHSGRMDLRVSDEEGNPVRGVKVHLVSDKPPALPPDFVCECSGETDENGRYLGPPIHVGGKLTLKVEGRGFQSFEATPSEQILAAPVRVVLARKPRVSRFKPSSTISSCSDLFKMFFAYAELQLLKGRADYQAGRFNDAETDFADLLATTSLSQISGFKEARRFRAAALTSLADISFRKGDLATARTRYSQALDDTRRDGRLDLSWAAHAGLGRTLWALAQQPRLALAHQYESDRRAAHGVDQANAATLQSDALNAYREALKEIETILDGSIRADEARTTFLATTHDVFVEAACALADSALNSPGSSPTVREGATSSVLTGSSLTLAAEAFAVAEASRARSLLDLLDDSRADITQGVSPDLLKRKNDNLARQQEIAQQLTGIALTGDAQQSSVAALETELQTLAVDFDSIENQIRTSSPRYGSLVHPWPLTLEQVQRQVLDDDTALVEYCLGEKASYLWVVTRANVQLFKLGPRAQIEKLAIDFRAQLIPPKLRRRIVGIDVTDDRQRGFGLAQGPSENVAAFVTASSALYQAVIAPAAGLLTNKRLLIVADGALNYIPFEALATSIGGADYAALNYLVKSNEIVYAPSASVIDAIRNQRGSSPIPREGSAQRILLVADPVFSPDDPRLKGRSAVSQSSAESRGLGLGLASAVNDIAGGASIVPASGLQLARLAGTRTEAEEIAKIARASGRQTDEWMDLNANEDNLRGRDVTGYRVLHIATHGLLDAEHPQFTGVVLSLIGNKTNDGFLRTDEIFNLKLGTPLVMLSACETGLGREKRGEGVIGLTRAFMYAGAPTVGVSLWSVADKSTADLMTEFYRRLLTPAPYTPSPAALRDAQLAMIAGKKYSAPFYWAPFVLVGEWK